MVGSEMKEVSELSSSPIPCRLERSTSENPSMNRSGV